jgi:flavin-dependent dehydrogenase
MERELNACGIHGGASSDVVVIGVDIVGCVCTYYLTQAGLTTCLLDRGPVVRREVGVVLGTRSRPRVLPLRVIAEASAGVD